MEKALPKREWFDRLLTVGQYDRFVWLTRLTGQVQRVLSVGCWSDEPFALLWATNASELVVVEKNLEFIHERQEDQERLTKQIPEAFVGRSIKFVNADITQPVDNLEFNSFDLVFCENVLYNFQDASDQLEFAVGQMVNSLKPKGVFIAIEPKFGAEFKMVESFLGTISIGTTPRQISEPKNISFVFESQGLVKVNGELAYWTYVYRKE